MSRLKDALIENPYWERGYIHGACGIPIYAGIKLPLAELDRMAYEGAYEHGESDAKYGTVEFEYFTPERCKRLTDTLRNDYND